jgi:DNA-binding LytR/AlgR family response regulator
MTSNGFEAQSIINESKPDLVFLKVELPEINGIELLKQCIYDPYIIFISASERYAIRAFEAKTVYYLLKPYLETQLLAVFNKLEKMVRQPAAAPPPTASLPFLAIKNGETTLLVKKESIVWIGAEGKYTIIATVKKQYVSSFTISELEQRLQSTFFMRIHRSYIVNLRHVVEMRKYGTGKMKLVTVTPAKEDIVVSRNYLDKLKQRLKID